MIQQTSRDAFLRNIKTLNDRQQKVLMIISTKYAICNQEIAEELKWPINSVTPRCLELREKGLVEEAFRDTYEKTGRKVIFWKQKPQYETSLREYGDD